MEKIFVIIECNAYDAFELPYEEVFYLSEAEAKKDCEILNKKTGSKRDYFDVHELTLKQS